MSNVPTTPICFKCQQPGHFANVCPNIIDPTTNNGYQPNVGGYQQRWNPYPQQQFQQGGPRFQGYNRGAFNYQQQDVASNKKMEELEKQVKDLAEQLRQKELDDLKTTIKKKDEEIMKLMKIIEDQGNEEPDEKAAKEAKTPNKPGRPAKQ